MKYYQFVEPYFMEGAVSEITISEKDLLVYLKSIDRYIRTDEETIAEFCMVHWAHECDVPLWGRE